MYRNERKNIFLILGIPAILIFAAIFYYSSYFATETTVQISVEDKEREHKGYGKSSSSKYIVHTKGESFEVTDQLLYFKFNSTDIYRELKRGKTYRVRVVGWRKPFLSWYRNILRIEAEVTNTGSASAPISN